MQKIINRFDGAGEFIAIHRKRSIEHYNNPFRRSRFVFPAGKNRVCLKKPVGKLISRLRIAQIVSGNLFGSAVSDNGKRIFRRIYLVIKGEIVC